jgi:hypothetical protein
MSKVHVSSLADLEKAIGAGTGWEDIVLEENGTFLDDLRAVLNKPAMKAPQQLSVEPKASLVHAASPLMQKLLSNADVFEASPLNVAIMRAATNHKWSISC